MCIRRASSLSTSKSRVATRPHSLSHSRSLCETTHQHMHVPENNEDKISLAIRYVVENQ